MIKILKRIRCGLKNISLYQLKKKIIKFGRFSGGRGIVIPVECIFVDKMTLAPGAVIVSYIK